MAIRSASKPKSAPAAQIAAERQASLAEQRLHAAIDALPEGIVFLDPEGRYILWNQRYAEIYKRSADLFAVGARLEDTLRVGVARGDYPDAVGGQPCPPAALRSQAVRLRKPPQAVPARCCRLPALHAFRMSWAARSNAPSSGSCLHIFDEDYIHQ